MLRTFGFILLLGLSLLGFFLRTSVQTRLGVEDSGQNRASSPFEGPEASSSDLPPVQEHTPGRPRPPTAAPTLPQAAWWEDLAKLKRGSSGESRALLDLQENLLKESWVGVPDASLSAEFGAILAVAKTTGSSQELEALPGGVEGTGGPGGWESGVPSTPLMEPGGTEWMQPLSDSAAEVGPSGVLPERP